MTGVGLLVFCDLQDLYLKTSSQNIHVRDIKVLHPEILSYQCGHNLHVIILVGLEQMKTLNFASLLWHLV
jgi:hypothetical protein